MGVLRPSRRPAASADGGSGVARGGDDPPAGPRRLLVVVASLVLLLAGCSGSGGHPAGDGPATTASPSTAVATAAAVLSAYRAGWAAYENALATANAYDPALQATMTNPLLQRVRGNLLSDQNAGIVGRGGVQLNPRVASMTATTASVTDCSFSSSKLVYAKTGKPVPPVTPPEHDYVQATLVLVNGTWKVSQQTVTEGKCPAGV